MTNKVQFLKKTYVVDDGPQDEGDIVVAELPTKELVSLHNLVASNLDKKSVKKFADRKTAVRRTQEILKTYGAYGPVEEDTKPTPAPKKSTKGQKQRNPRQKYFVFKPAANVTLPKGDDTLRAKALRMLKKGATEKQIQEMIVADDEEKSRKQSKTVERRAYELIRIIHYHFGWGLKMGEAKGQVIITAYAE